MRRDDSSLTNGQGVKLQILAQADNRDEASPSFENQHLNLRRGDIIGRPLSIAVSLFPAPTGETHD